MKKKCKFCNQSFPKLIKVYDYKNNLGKGKFLECKNCNIIYQPNVIKNLYNKQNTSNYNFKKNFFYYLKQIIFLNYICKIKKFFHKKKDILDYGCGSGELAISLGYFYKNKNIYTADVFRLDKNFMPNIKKHYELNKGKLKNKKFDVIIMRHVFEHIYDLSGFVKTIKKNLKNRNSNLIIEVPSMNSLWRKIMNKRWPGYFYPFHYYVFSRKFLETFFSKNGLKIIGEKKLEPPIIGSYLITFGVNKSICKFLSIIFYPVQVLFSKIFSSSEAILIIAKKNND